MAQRTGIFPSKGHELMALPDYRSAEFDGWPVFPDEREGVDRWGRERATLMACGTGWGPDEWVCPAYVQEACPGEVNDGDRFAVNYMNTCNLLCGECGGAGRADTMAYCGVPKGAFAFDGILAELGGNLRLDQRTAPRQRAAVPDFGKRWFPTVQWGVKHWMPKLNAYEQERAARDYPALATTFKSATPGKRAKFGVNAPLRYRQDVRERLGGFQGTLLVNGLTKDDVLDDVWDDLDNVMKFCMASSVDVMVTPQFSYYEQTQNCMAVVNSNRIFAFYRRILEEGFPVAVLDCPPYALPWLRDDYLTFIVENRVKMIALSYQTFKARGGLIPFHVKGAMDWHRDLPEDVALMVFGLTQPLATVQLVRLFEGRRMYFSGSNPFALAAFFNLQLAGQKRPIKAPPDMDKGDVFVENVKAQEFITEQAWNVVYDG